MTAAECGAERDDPADRADRADTADRAAESDDDWDRAADAELDALAAETPPPPPPRPWVAPAPLTRSPIEREPRLAILSPDDVGEFVRACRATAGLSQRGLAEASGMAQSSVARIESGRGGGIELATLCRLASGCGVALVGVTGTTGAAGGVAEPELVLTDPAQRHRGPDGRRLPAHLVNRRVESWHGAWWGDDRYTHGRPRPRHSYVRDLRYRDLPPPDRTDGPAQG